MFAGPETTKMPMPAMPAGEGHLLAGNEIDPTFYDEMFEASGGQMVHHWRENEST